MSKNSASNISFIIVHMRYKAFPALLVII